MRRPKPLANLTSTTGRANTSDFHTITPRTPHSRSGLAEEGFTEVELDDLGEDEEDYRTIRQQQAAPLLASSSGGTGYRSRGDDHDNPSKNKQGLNVQVVLSRIPLLLGIVTAGLLLILIFLSLKRPEALEKIVGNTALGASATTSPPSAAATQEKTPVPHTGSPPMIHSDVTVLSYENYTKFPLLPAQYRAECAKLHHGYMSHGDYWDIPSTGILDVVHHDDTRDYHLPEGERTAVCKSTITYMLDGKVGLLADLALMAQVAALARERGRTFLVDDTYWNRGKWTDHFQDIRSRQPGPEPGCRAPPPEELVACPRLARHWVVNSRTAKYHLGHGFSNHYEDSYEHALNRLKPIFDAGTDSFSGTIRPNAKTANLIRAARQELMDTISSRSPQQLETNQDGPIEDSLPYIAVHVRRGDRKSASYSYPDRQIPLSEYTSAASDVWARIMADNVSSVEDATLNPMVYLASDSPSTLNEFLEVFPQKFSTPSVFSLSLSKDPELRALASPEAYFQLKFNALDLETRVRATSGMIVDLALVSGMWAYDNEVVPQAVVCAVSSNPCKVSAMGLGWDVAFGGVDKMGYINNTAKRWVDVDIKGQVVPVWEPFELFN